MELLSSYPQLKQAHIGLVLASGLLFAVRGAAVLAGQRWATRTPWRRLSYGAALATYLFIATVAVKHHPLGLFLGT